MGMGKERERLTHLFRPSCALWVRLFVLQPGYSGHEKGAVESKVGMVRRKLFVPGRAYGARRTLTPGCRTGASELATKTALPQRTRRNVACSPRTVRRCCRCPGKRFDVAVAAYEGRPVRRGHARGTASLFRGPGERGAEGVIVGLRARGRGPRLVGQASGDPSSGVRRGQHERRGPVHAAGAASATSPRPRPLNSRVRDALPDPLREWLDRQDRQTRNEALQTLKRVDRGIRVANAVEAMLSILDRPAGADRAGVHTARGEARRGRGGYRIRR